jgi:hypothetical protein
VLGRRRAHMCPTRSFAGLWRTSNKYKLCPTKITQSDALSSAYGGRVLVIPYGPWRYLKTQKTRAFSLPPLSLSLFSYGPDPPRLLQHPLPLLLQKSVLGLTPLCFGLTACLSLSVDLFFPSSPLSLFLARFSMVLVLPGVFLGNFFNS